MTDTQVGDPLIPEPAPPGKRRRRINWKAVIGLAGLVGLAIAASTSANKAQGQELPGLGALGAAYVLHVVGLMCAAQAWIALFPPAADRRALAGGLYMSQLTKYLPAGGFVQQASQVALSSQDGVATAALRLPVFALCGVAAGATGGSVLAFDSDLPIWGRLLAAAGLGIVVALDRRVLQLLLRTARRFVKRLPDPSTLPSQGAILRSYAFLLVDIVVFAAAFVVLVDDLADGVDPVMTAAALSAGWVLGYVAVIFPSGLGVREGVLLAVLAVPNAALLAASIAHRVLGLAAEASLAGASQLRAALAARRGDLDT